eukprot:SAG11_NODE_16810_length_537_cov_0.742009_1_plen_80_part_01
MRERLRAARVRGGLGVVAAALDRARLCLLEAPAAEEVGDEGGGVDRGLAGGEVGLGLDAVDELRVAEGLRHAATAVADLV